MTVPISYAQYRGSRITTAPTVEPVTAAELRTHLRTDATDLPDATADDYITEARQEIEDQTGLALINQSWQLTIDRWPNAREPWFAGMRQMAVSALNAGNGSLSMPRYPLSSVTSVTTYDEDGDSTAVTVADVFDIDTQQMPGRMTLQVGASWPSALRANNAIEVVYVAGYGSAASDIPTPLVRAVRNMAAYIYAHRGDGCPATDAYADSGAAKICAKYRVRQL